MREIVLALAGSALLLSSASAATHRVATGWSYRATADKMHDGLNRWACVRSANVVRLGFPYRSQALSLCVRSTPENGTDVYVSLPDGGQFECSDGCDVEARFDTAPVQTIGADTPDDGSDDTIFIGDNEQFVTSLRSAKRLMLEITFYNAGTQQLSFDVAGLRWPATPVAVEPTPTPPPPPPEFLTNPAWSRSPSSDDMDRFYPERAQRMGVSGHVTMRCVTGENGSLTDCTILEENPSDQEFGGAALKLSKVFKLPASTQPGSKIDIPLTFNPPRD